ncbi:LytTR family DNA-binding domain-containing protein [Paraflavitalea speifideaquila]|uniref:LytR/AlgR family response regulator transcription factor n=1 Tax=Paraflavitalea speifideaquila TaxID=3076558 RepID=UPI0028E6F23B|nr:LytTR family DNA-binding domain-containing protein [Paraflavitalea speifideiaquila]
MDGNLVKVFHEEILYAQSLKDYMKIVTPTGNHITHLTMKSLLELLPDQHFKRIHRSYVVNTNHLTIIGKRQCKHWENNDSRG